MSLKIFMLADDLTGAMDSSVFFAQQGYRTLVTVRAPENPENFLRDRMDAVEVLTVNTESRHMTPEAAGRIVYDFARAAAKLGVPCIYKKTDSALRGNVAAELLSAYRAAGVRQLPFLPALPQMNRIVRDGIGYIDGTPVHESDLGRDPLNPVKTSVVAELFAVQEALPVPKESTGGSGQPAPVEISGKRYDAAVSEAEGICIYDAWEEAHLEILGRKLGEKGMLRICAGSGGFAKALAAHFSDSRQDEKQDTGRVPPGDGMQKKEPVGTSAADPDPAQAKENSAQVEGNGCAQGGLLICGSVSEMAMQQIRYARKAGLWCRQIPADWFSRTPAQLLQEMEDASGPVSRFLTECALRIRQGETPVLYTGGQHLVSERIAEKTALLTRQLIEKNHPGRLYVFGGDTLKGIMDVMGVDGIYPEREVMPGMVQGHLQMGAYVPVICTKAGSFGGPDLIGKLLNGDPAEKTVFTQ